MRHRILLNDPPHGSELCYNALRLGPALLETDPEDEIMDGARRSSRGELAESAASADRVPVF